MNRNELLSLITLLDDPDTDIQSHVENKLESLGLEIIPTLEEQWHLIKDNFHQQRIEDVIHHIQFKALQKDLIEWYQSDTHDLLDGVILIARYRFPTLKRKEIQEIIDQLYLDIWLEMRPQYAAIDKIRVFNEIFYSAHGFKGNIETYHDPQNSFINQVLQSRKGSPIMLSVIYMLLCRKLKLPVFGVNLPQHFVLLYKENLDEETLLTPDFSDKFIDFGPGKGIPLFYINAFTNGNIFTKSSIESFLKQLKIEPRFEFFEPCSHVEIIKRMLRNLLLAYEKQQKNKKQKDIRHLLFLLGEPPIDQLDVFGSDSNSDDF